MSDPEAFTQFVLRVLRAADEWGPGCDCIWWRSDGDFAPVTFFVNCSDVFHWGCADVETLTPENIAVFEEAVADCRRLVAAERHGPMLFCARVRQERPQGAAYPDERELWPLFDACGPEREVGLGNPYKPGQMQDRVKKLAEDQDPGPLPAGFAQNVAEPS